ncbi:unnamed protein product [Periconia digitata]|uniref:Uncharacterized protein n=1 Tax=Periconia digitata TaxID=1303443 RepID=A0A9W4UWD7_9PLEO|nr:unnamed protein product [Periconia digitata]
MSPIRPKSGAPKKGPSISGGILKRQKQPRVPKKNIKQFTKSPMTIEDIMKVYRIIISTAVHHYSKRKLVKIEESGTVHKKKRPGVPVYVATAGPGSEKTTSTAPAHLVKKYGQELGSRLYKAYKMLDMCDWSMLVSLEPARAKLADFHAKVDWIYCVPNRDFIMTLGCEEDEEEYGTEVAHSVLRIKDAAGHVTISDFTLEQFGWSSDDFFLPMETFFDRFAESRKWKVTDSKALEGPENPYERAYVELIRNLCANVDWDKMEALGEEARSSLLRRKTVKAIKGH